VLPITSEITIPAKELRWTFVRSSGPGGQNVNKVASRAVLRWNVLESRSIPEAVKARLRLLHPRITSSGEVVISSQRFRDQDRNRGDCLEKLRHIILRAMTPPKPRKLSRPTRGSREARLANKKRRAATKSLRRKPDPG
jgi:ribosome-associated protein